MINLIIGFLIGAVVTFFVAGNNKGKFEKLYNQARQEIDELKEKLDKKD